MTAPIPEAAVEAAARALSPNPAHWRQFMGNARTALTSARPLMEAEIRVTFTVVGGRCWPEEESGSDDYCQQTFRTFEDADKHRLERHAAPEWNHIYETHEWSRRICRDADRAATIAERTQR